MLTAPTNRGPLYMKAIEPAFAFEPLTRALAQRWPRHLPPVVAIDAARGGYSRRTVGRSRRPRP